MADWLHRAVQLPQYVSGFLENEIDGAMLVELLPSSPDNKARWAELGVEAQHQRQICKEVRKLVGRDANEDDDDDDDDGVPAFNARDSKSYRAAVEVKSVTAAAKKPEAQIDEKPLPAWKRQLQKFEQQAAKQEAAAAPPAAPAAGSPRT